MSRFPLPPYMVNLTDNLVYEIESYIYQNILSEVINDIMMERNVEKYLEPIHKLLHIIIYQNIRENLRLRDYPFLLDIVDKKPSPFDQIYIERLRRGMVGVRDITTRIDSPIKYQGNNLKECLSNIIEFVLNRELENIVIMGSTFDILIKELEKCIRFKTPIVESQRIYRISSLYV